MNYKKLKVLVSTLLLLSNFGYCQHIYEDQKTFHQSFKVAPKANVQVSNKYGNVHFIIWDKDSVRFEVEMMVKASKPEKVKKIKEFVSFDFSGSQNYLIGQTSFNSSSLWTDVATMANTLFSTGTSVNISYYVYLPADCNIKVINKFGNVYMNNHHGSLEANISNGDLKAGDIDGDLKLNLQFGNTSIGNIKNGRISLEFAELNLEKSESLIIDSRSSRIEVKEVDLLDLTSRRDKIYITKVNTITGQTNFTNLNLKFLNEQIILNAKYGDLSFDNIGRGFKLINITSLYSQITLFFERPTSFQFDILNHKTDLRLPIEYKQDKQATGVNNGEVRIVGNTGNPNAISKLRLNNVYGRVNLYER